MWAPMGNLAPQLPGVVTFAYDLCFRLRLQFDCGEPKKHYLGLQNSPGSTTRCDDMKTYKMSQLD
jgi:hypothetical protein